MDPEGEQPGKGQSRTRTAQTPRRVAQRTPGSRKRLQAMGGRGRVGTVQRQAESYRLKALLCPKKTETAMPRRTHS